MRFKRCLQPIVHAPATCLRLKSQGDRRWSHEHRTGARTILGSFFWIARLQSGVIVRQLPTISRCDQSTIQNWSQVFVRAMYDARRIIVGLLHNHYKTVVRSLYDNRSTCALWTIWIVQPVYSPLIIAYDQSSTFFIVGTKSHARSVVN